MERAKNPFRAILISTLLWGLLAHGMMFFNKYSFHDDARLAFHIGATVSSGRWALEIIKRIFQSVFGNLYSLPVFNGSATLLLTALTVYVVVKTLRIRTTAGAVMFAGIAATFPSLTALLGYMYTAPYYSMGFCLASAGAWLICSSDRKKWLFLPAGCFLVACGTGVYQACIPFVLTLLLLRMVCEVLDDPLDRDFRFFCSGLKLAGACALFLAVYLLLNSLGLRLMNTQLSDYETISTFGFSGWAEYWHRACRAYHEFFVPPAGKLRDMYPLASLRWLRYALTVFGVMLCIDRALILFRICPRRCAEFLLLTALFPLAVNFILVMVDVEMVHSLMTGAQILTFAFFIILLEHTSDDHVNYPNWLPRTGLALVTTVVVLFCYFSNICYFKAAVLQSQAISYFTRLISRIESTPGYSPELPVVYLNDLKKQDLSSREYKPFKEVRLIPYLYDDRIRLINNYAWKDFMSLWCGYSPLVLQNTESFEKLPEVLAMPRYPLAGSVKVLNGTVVVKF